MKKWSSYFGSLFLDKQNVMMCNKKNRTFHFHCGVRKGRKSYAEHQRKKETNKQTNKQREGGEAVIIQYIGCLISALLK